MKLYRFEGRDREVSEGVNVLARSLAEARTLLGEDRHRFRAVARLPDFAGPPGVLFYDGDGRYPPTPL